MLKANLVSLFEKRSETGIAEGCSSEHEWPGGDVEGKRREET